MLKISTLLGLFKGTLELATVENLNLRQARETPDKGASPVCGGENSRFRLRWGGNRC
jgi:hypothetical protein